METLMRRAALAFLVAVALLGAACGTDKGPTEKASVSNDETTSTAEPSSGDSSDTTVPPGSVPGAFDWNDDGQPELMCGTKDYGAGLVLRTWCDQQTQAGYAPDPPEGVTLTKDSLFRLPGPPGGGELPGFEGMSGSTLAATDTSGNKVIVITFNSDGLFETGGSTVNGSSLDAVIRGMNQNYAPGKVQVRGHTDSTGSAAANQTLSEQRAAAVKSYLQSHGMKATEFSSLGLASTLPMAEEDGDAGRAFNRRVEIAVTVPKG
jgi:outer membrane protein OmpA-like peptidoglycan-associated protein